MTKYSFYLELTPPIFTVDAESLEEAQNIADKMIAEFGDKVAYRVTSNLYAEEFWETETESYLYEEEE